MGDEQDRAEQLDADNVVEGYPPDVPTGVEEDGVTPAEETVGESLEERVAREDRGTHESAEVIQPLSDEDEAVEDDEAQLVAEAEPSPRDPEADDAPEPAEETAMHVER